MPNRRSSNRKIILALLSLSLVFISISISWLPVSASDTDPPYIIDLKVKPNDRLELGDTPFFEVKVEDKSGINQVLIEFEGANHTMDEKADKKWTYNSWTPTAMGTYIFTIHAEDKLGNWAQERGKLEIVIDATLPEVVIISAPEGDLEGGESTKITIFANDSYEIIQVLIEFGDMMEPMVKTADPNIWEYELEIPSDAGIYTYTIHVEDINHNWNYISGSIEVVTIPEPRLGPGPVNIWGFIAIISIIIIGISIAIAVRINKQTGDQRSERSSQILKDKNHYLLRGHSKIVEVKCPSCRMKKNVPLSISIPPDSNGLCTVYIYRNVVCEHSFHFYIDNNYDIRGSEPVDYSFGEEL